MYRKLEEVNFGKPPYSVRYPQLAEILQGDPAVPKGNVVRRNICWGGRWLDLQGVDKSIVATQDNLTETDPCFVDRDNMNFQLKDNSPAYELGFKRIPMEEIGLIRNSSSRSEVRP